MTPIILRVITSALITLSLPIIISVIKPLTENSVSKDENEAKDEKTVHPYKKSVTFFAVSLILLNIIGILIVALPEFITGFLQFDYIITIVVWWFPILFDDVVICCLYSTRAIYDDEKITVKKIFRRPKVYYFKDIISYTKTGNLKVETAKGNFTLFNMYIGTQSLREFIAEKTETNKIPT